MGAKDEVGKIEYHYGFYGAVHVEYEPSHVNMEYLQEHELGDEPVRMDMLILKQDRTPLTDPIGSFFKTHNVLEYKSPQDQLSINDFCKAQGYALLYKGLSKTVDSVPLEELTVSIFRHAYPREMFKTLRGYGICIEEKFPGIYHVSGPLTVPAQVIVTSRLKGDRYEAFKALAKNVSKEDIWKLLKLAQDEPSMTDFVRAILNVSMPLNERMFVEMEMEMMNKTLENIFKKEFDEKKQEGRKEGLQEGRQEGLQEGRQEGLQEGVDQTRVDAIRNLMKKLKFTAKQAMDFLDIPDDDRSKYLAKL